MSIAFDSLPGPDLNSIKRKIATGLRMRRDPVPDLARWQAEFGDTVRLDFGPRKAVVVYHPDDIHAVLVAQADKFHKDVEYHDEERGVGRFLGRGLVTSDGDLWKRQRRLMAPAFHARRIEHYATQVRDLTRDMLARWHDGAELDLAEAMTDLTMRVVTQVLFGAEMHVDGAKVGRAIHAIGDYLAHPALLPPWVPTPAELRTRRASALLDGIVYDIIAQRRAAGAEGRNDLLAMLLEARDEAGQPLADKQVRDEIVTLFVAGHETTSNTLAWAVSFLATLPDVEADLLAEVDAVLGGRLPEFAAVPGLTVTERVIKETLRLRTPTMIITRQAIAPVSLRAGELPAGISVYLPLGLVHRDPRWYPEPMVFDPGRWTPEREAALPRGAYQPFGGGPRICIGNSLAMLEARMVLAAIYARFLPRLQAGARIEPLFSLTLTPRYGVPVRLTARRVGETAALAAG